MSPATVEEVDAVSVAELIALSAFAPAAAPSIAITRDVPTPQHDAGAIEVVASDAHAKKLAALVIATMVARSFIVIVIGLCMDINIRRQVSLVTLKDFPPLPANSCKQPTIYSHD